MSRSNTERGIVMRKEVNYIEEFRQEMKEMETFKSDKSDISSSDTSADLEELHLRIKQHEIEESQYTRVRNEERWHIWIEIIYPYLEMEAKLQGLHVILDVNDEKLTGKITISGEKLFLSNQWCESKDCFATMLQYSNDFWISNENGLFVIEVLFDLYDKEKTFDKTQEIEKAKQDFNSFRLQHGKKARFKFNP